MFLQVPDTSNNYQVDKGDEVELEGGFLDPQQTTNLPPSFSNYNDDNDDNDSESEVLSCNITYFMHFITLII